MIIPRFICGQYDEVRVEAPVETLPTTEQQYITNKVMLSGVTRTEHKLVITAADVLPQIFKILDSVERFLNGSGRSCGGTNCTLPFTEVILTDRQMVLFLVDTSTTRIRQRYYRCCGQSRMPAERFLTVVLPSILTPALL
jgi:hypothetical protein